MSCCANMEAAKALCRLGRDYPNRLVTWTHLIGHGVWNNQVHAIRLSIDMLVNPIELDL